MIGFIIKKILPTGANPDSSATRERCGTVSGLIGIGLNLLLCIGKFTAGAVTGAISVMADAFNNLMDAASSVVTMIGFRLASQKPDDDHPFGHGRAEYLAGLIVSMLILLVGFELVKSVPIRFTFTVEGEQIRNLFSMTPHVFRIGKEGAQRLRSVRALTDTASCVLNIYRKTG